MKIKEERIEEMFLLSDRENSEKVLQEGFKYKKQLFPQVKSLFRYLDYIGKTEQESLQMVENALRETEMLFKYVEDRDVKEILNKTRKDSLKIPFKEIIEVEYSQEEINFLKKIENLEEQKLYFVILGLYKWNNNNDFVIKPRDLHRLAKNKGSLKDRADIMHSLVLKGFVKVYTKKKGQDIFFSPLFTKKGEMELKAPVTQTLVEIWKEYNKIDYIQCEVCGKWQKKKKNTHKYCEDCFKIYRKQYLSIYFKNRN